MAVFKRGYERYDGPVTGRMTRLLVVPRFAWRRLLGQRFVLILLVTALFWPMVCMGFIYLSNHTEMLTSMGGGGLRRMMTINGRFFAIFMNVQSGIAMLLASIAGPGLIAPDLANNALPLYFARPMSRGEYILARLIVLLGILSLVTLLPAMLLFGMQSAMAGMGWLGANWDLGAGVAVGFTLWILMVSLVALACSAYVKWRVVAGALVLAFFFLLAGASEILNKVLRVEWGSLLNPGYAMWTIWCAMLGVEAPEGPGVFGCSVAVALLLAALVGVLFRKLRPVEVVG